jgi:hypothetical protein
VTRFEGKDIDHKTPVRAHGAHGGNVRFAFAPSLRFIMARASLRISPSSSLRMTR